MKINFLRLKTYAFATQNLSRVVSVLDLKNYRVNIHNYASSEQSKQR